MEGEYESEQQPDHLEGEYEQQPERHIDDLDEDTNVNGWEADCEHHTGNDEYPDVNETRAWENSHNNHPDILLKNATQQHPNFVGNKNTTAVPGPSLFEGLECQGTARSTRSSGQRTDRSTHSQHSQDSEFYNYHSQSSLWSYDEGNLSDFSAHGESSSARLPSPERLMQYHSPTKKQRDAFVSQASAGWFDAARTHVPT
jgi:hypothetical protein